MLKLMKWTPHWDLTDSQGKDERVASESRINFVFPSCIKNFVCVSLVTFIMNYYPHFIDEAIRVQRNTCLYIRMLVRKNSLNSRFRTPELPCSFHFPLPFKISMEGQWELSAIQVPKLEGPVGK